jgi:hypothetical protein
VFQLIVDEILKGGSFHLILCGSSISMMEKPLLLIPARCMAIVAAVCILLYYVLHGKKSVII